MRMLKNKKILLGVTGSIAAYKIAYLIRILRKQDAQVKVIQTKQSINFISSLTLSTLSKNPVYSSLKTDSGWNNHVELGLWADIMIIAPATANTISKMVSGQADNLLLATYLSAKCPVYFAPAMDLDMYKHKSTINNMDKLKSYGVKLIPADYGELASGLIGKGRMAEPEDIVKIIVRDFNKSKILSKKRVLITAGPTYESIDPVRFIGNRSSGKMGIALARYAADCGANVDLVLGPSHETLNHSNVKIYNVESAEDMFNQVDILFSESDIVISSAAVSDFTPEKTYKQKIKKNNEKFTLELKKSKDILFEVSKIKRKSQFIVGFALESENELINAKNKLKSKDLDMIVLNSLNDCGAGFNSKTNKITIINRDQTVKAFGLKQKEDVAKDIIDYIFKKIK